MCGRFTQRYTWRELVELYRLTQPPLNLEPHYNIAPTMTIDVVIRRDGGNALVPMRWGLIPWWWKKPLKDLPPTFNARAETVATKPMFRDAFKRSRCVIPASGYYEWRPTPSGKQPYYITSASGPVLSKPVSSRMIITAGTHAPSCCGWTGGSPRRCDALPRRRPATGRIGSPNACCRREGREAVGDQVADATALMTSLA